jgi:hypothetical protein
MSCVESLIATVNDLNNQDTASCWNFPSVRASRKANVYSISPLLLRNLSDVSGENDRVRRRSAIDEIFHADAIFYDPKAVYFVAVTRLIVLLGSKQPIQISKYQPLFPPEELGDAGRVRWVAYAGTDFIAARNGRIASVCLFFDILHSLRVGRWERQHHCSTTSPGARSPMCARSVPRMMSGELFRFQKRHRHLPPSFTKVRRLWRRHPPVRFRRVPWKILELCQRALPAKPCNATAKGEKGRRRLKRMPERP